MLAHQPSAGRPTGVSAGRLVLSLMAVVLSAIGGGWPHLALGSEETGAARTFEIVASRYTFDPARIEVKQEDHVRLDLRSADTTHGLEIEGYGVKVVIPKGGEEVGVEFIAHRPGRFRMKCSEYCGSGHRRMQGWFIVEEAGR